MICCYAPCASVQVLASQVLVRRLGVFYRNTIQYNLIILNPRCADGFPRSWPTAPALLSPENTEFHAAFLHLFMFTADEPQVLEMLFLARSLTWLGHRGK
ncbi:hypothetical protein PoB_003982200 [Plakobranchus ocellatus]|uniref:Uncharacterized protein n=1 Tax=Plakobranchus ocellatus TaxID=259542 RepID=A0AAV4B265_9GAST|nr:hypothetical protein PoB_003982200 [Plakobranchus ocellatus]